MTVQLVRQGKIHTRKVPRCLEYKVKSEQNSGNMGCGEAEAGGAQRSLHSTNKKALSCKGRQTTALHEQE